MSFVLTLVSSQINMPLTNGHIKSATRFLEDQGLSPTCAPVWLHPDKAADVGFSSEATFSQLKALRSLLHQDKIDFFFGSIEKRRKKILVADMDSTIISAETLDELADEAGIKAQIAEITELAMNGEMDFHAAIRARIALLKDLPVAAMERTLARMEYNPGAELLVRTMVHYGARTVLVTGGFTFFSEPVGRRIGFQHHHANILEIKDGCLSGKVREPILDKNAKVKALYEHCQELGVRPDHALAIGDGANDLPMLKTAGMGIGYKPKRLVAEEIANLILHGDLSAALYAQGYTEQHIREAVS